MQRVYSWPYLGLEVGSLYDGIMSPDEIFKLAAVVISIALVITMGIKAFGEARFVDRYVVETAHKLEDCIAKAMLSMGYEEVLLLYVPPPYVIVINSNSLLVMKNNEIVMSIELTGNVMIDGEELKIASFSLLKVKGVREGEAMVRRVKTWP